MTPVRAHTVWPVCRPNWRQLTRESSEPSATRRSPRPPVVAAPTDRRPGPQAATSLQQGEGRPDVPAPKAKNLESAPPQNCALKRAQPQPFGAGTSGRSSPGHHRLAAPMGRPEVRRSEMSRQTVGPRRPRLRAWPCRPQPPSPMPADRTPSYCRPHRRPSTPRRSW